MVYAIIRVYGLQYFLLYCFEYMNYEVLIFYQLNTILYCIQLKYVLLMNFNKNVKLQTIIN